MSDRPTPETAPLMHAAANESIEAVFRRGCDLERQRDEARKILAATLSALPVGYLPNHTPESIPERVADLVARYAEAERQRDLLIHGSEDLSCASDWQPSADIMPDQHCACENPGPHHKPGNAGKFCAVCGKDLPPNARAMPPAKD